MVNRGRLNESPKKMAEGRKEAVQSLKTLYKLSVCAVAGRLLKYKKFFIYLPENVFFDLYYELYLERRLCILGVELGDLANFSRLLNVTSRRVQLIQCFQALMDHATMIGKDLAISYNISCLQVKEYPAAHDKVINTGLSIGEFLSDAGWYAESELVLLTCKKLCVAAEPTPKNLCHILTCCRKLLHAQIGYCAFHGAAETFDLAMDTIQKLRSAGYDNINYAALYVEFSVLFFIRSEYDEAFKWSIEALKQLKPMSSSQVMIDVLRQAAKSCVMKRKYDKAAILIKQALRLAKEVFDTDHPKYSDVLIDCAFYLLNYDFTAYSVALYKAALVIRVAIFGKTNLQVALAHENLAYALYVYEYNTGDYERASYHANKAIEMMEKLLAGDHIMLASARRVKALILEELALVHPVNPLSGETLLQKSEYLHLSALQLAKTAFGEKNIQTAKHYGNLGRLYQSMKKFAEAEAMHLKCISIKEELLGPDDYEVGLSLGHLASLYSFHMNRYRDAEKLYCRSIAISLKLFGNGYSGLQYDYNGLIHIYLKLKEHDKVMEYTDLWHRWRELRRKHVQSEESLINFEKRPRPIEEVISVFFSM